jgi:hypothetical protein
MLPFRYVLSGTFLHVLSGIAFMFCWTRSFVSQVSKDDADDEGEEDEGRRVMMMRRRMRRVTSTG